MNEPLSKSLDARLGESLRRFRPACGATKPFQKEMTEDTMTSSGHFRRELPGTARGEPRPEQYLKSG